MEHFGQKIRKWSRTIHRDLSYIFTGMMFVYVVSGFMLNHRKDINPYYTTHTYEYRVKGDFPLSPESLNNTYVSRLVAMHNLDGSKATYKVDQNLLKISISRSAALSVNLQTGDAVFQQLQNRPFLGTMNRLHRALNKWWIPLSDAFLIGWLLIILTGLIMVKGPKGISGWRGGIELGIGILIPVLVILFL